LQKNAAIDIRPLGTANIGLADLGNLEIDGNNGYIVVIAKNYQSVQQPGCFAPPKGPTNLTPAAGVVEKKGTVNSLRYVKLERTGILTQPL